MPFFAQDALLCENRKNALVIFRFFEAFPRNNDLSNVHACLNCYLEVSFSEDELRITTSVCLLSLIPIRIAAM